MIGVLVLEEGNEVFMIFGGVCEVGVVIRVLIGVLGRDDRAARAYRIGGLLFGFRHESHLLYAWLHAIRYKYEASSIVAMAMVAGEAVEINRNRTIIQK